MAGEEPKARRASRGTPVQEPRAAQWPWAVVLLAGLGVVLFPPARLWVTETARATWKNFFFFTWLAVCALLPSAIAFAHRVRNNRRYVGARMEVLRSYLLAARHYASTRGRQETARIYTAGLDREALEQNRPGYLMLLGGAVSLALPFLLVATLSAAYLFPQVVTEPSLRSAVEGEYREGLRGLVFAGYGVYVYTLLLIIYRLQAAALSSEFLMTATLRALNTLVLGFVAGQTELFQVVGTTNQSGFLYFVLGAFPGWALMALRRRVVHFFQPSVPSQEALSLEYVEGINDRITERLEELGVADIQHLAFVDPGELTLRTLYPLSLTLDWVDQARLILYLRDKIGLARQAGVRGAIDMRELYHEAQVRDGEAPPNPAPRAGERARALLQDLATRAGLSLEALHNVGARLAEDYQVDFLAYLRNRRSLAYPLPALLEAIRHALEDSGLKSEGQTSEEGVAVGTFDARPLESPEVRRRFTERLSEDLGLMSLQWMGTCEELREADSFEELYDLILARIHLKPSEPPKPRPEPPVPPNRWPRWIQRAH